MNKEDKMKLLMPYYLIQLFTLIILFFSIVVLKNIRMNIYMGTGHTGEVSSFIVS